MGYGLLDDHGAGLHDIWGMTNTTAMAALIAAFATAFTAISIRVFTRSAVG